MITFKLEPNNFRPVKGYCQIIKIDNENLLKYISKIQESIDYFNDEIIWDEMFDIEIVKKRLNKNMDLYLGLNDNNPFGHVWFKNFEDGALLFNLFVRNKIEKKVHTGTEFVSHIIKNHYKNTIIYSEVDEWNIKSIKLFKKLGFILL